MPQVELLTLISIDGIELETAIHPTQQQTSIGTIIQVHGISVDMDEGGMFVRLADGLADVGFDVLRFSFRSHGRSGGTQCGMTIAGEMLDLQAVIKYVSQRFTKPLSIVAASFGAVSTCLSLPFIEGQLKALVLWNPVLDLRRTFIRPELPWAKQNFNPESVRQLRSRGYLLLDQEFQIGRVLYEEMKSFDPFGYFIECSVPSMIVHGDKDSYVPYDISKVASQEHHNCKLFTIENSDHGFDGRENEDKAIDITIDWLLDIHTSPNK